MSRRAEDRNGRPEEAALEELRAVMEEATDRLHSLRKRSQAAESRVVELEKLFRRFAAGEESPGEFVLRSRKLEEENGILRGRIEEGRGAVERLLARIRFLEERG